MIDKLDCDQAILTNFQTISCTETVNNAEIQKNLRKTNSFWRNSANQSNKMVDDSSKMISSRQLVNFRAKLDTPTGASKSIYSYTMSKSNACTHSNFKMNIQIVWHCIWSVILCYCLHQLSLLGYYYMLLYGNCQKLPWFVPIRFMNLNQNILIL